MATKPIKITSAKHLEEELQSLDALFQKKETEENWVARDKRWNRFREIVKSGIHEEYSDVFVAGLKMVLEHLVASVFRWRFR